uniref:Uncharacterized protein n=1 Tax=viral metagenome TaxID=1070528 RepID=A0A6C0JVW6_9ZZZZ
MDSSSFKSASSRMGSKMKSAVSSVRNAGMSASGDVKDRVTTLIQRLVQRAFLQYLALFVIVGLGFWLFFHYGTEWFKNEDGTKQIWMQAGAAFAMALAICTIAYFTRLL